MTVIPICINTQMFIEFDHHDLIKALHPIATSILIVIKYT